MKLTAATLDILRLFDITYQSNHHGILGRGPHSIPSSGCVLCSTYMSLRLLGRIDVASMSLEQFHQSCIDVGAFDDPGLEHDMLDVAKAISPFNARCDTSHISESLPENLAECFIDGGVALLRVGFRPDSSDHTIVAVSYADDAGSVACLDPAIGHVILSADLTAESLGWGHDAQGNHILRDYHAVNIRRIYRA